MILHTTSHVVIIATGFDRPSSNAKTGDMLQVWILTRDTHPAIAAVNGEDHHICGTCSLRRNPETGKRACYVDVSKAPGQIWKTYHAGRYPSWDGVSVDKFRNRTIRWGAYGDPVLIPFSTIEKINAVVRGWTGYTHQWRRQVFQAYRKFLMASADTEQDQQDAMAKGWRTFRVGDSPLPEGREILCPNSSHGIQCAQCRLCAGTSKGKLVRNIYIPAHGVGAMAHPSRRAAVLA